MQKLPLVLQPSNCHNHADYHYSHLGELEHSSQLCCCVYPPHAGSESSQLCGWSVFHSIAAAQTWSAKLQDALPCRMCFPGSTFPSHTWRMRAGGTGHCESCHQALRHKACSAACTACAFGPDCISSMWAPHAHAMLEGLCQTAPPCCINPCPQSCLPPSPTPSIAVQIHTLTPLPPAHRHCA